MTPSQEVNFHLSSNRVIFCQFSQLHDGTFTATATQAYDKGSIPATKHFSWAVCPTAANADAAFNLVISAIQNHCKRDGNSKLVTVHNPCNCELLTTQMQQNVVGPTVSVVVN